MCGIAGIIAYREGLPPVDRPELVAIRESMASRGPDGAGLWASEDGRAALAHRRLAIIDLGERGAQPMASADGRLHVTFNGEIYNYRELRAKLAAEGATFHSNSDTEVLLELYARRGPAMLDALRGMYAFAIWDEAAKSLFLARDPFGIKPLYYADDGNAFRFASQVKALLAGGAISRDPSPAGHVGFHLWGNVPEPFTSYRAIKALPAGSWMRVDAHGCGGPQFHFHLAAELAVAAERGCGARKPEVARQALIDTVKHHLVADVPVGLFLSSGIDSGLLTALATESGTAALRTITLGFEEFRRTPDDETPLARLVARRYGTAHEERWVSGADFQAALEPLLEAMDQPSIDGVNTYFVSRAARQAGMKVAMSGVGADELFGGYPSFVQIPRMRKALGPLGRIPGLGRACRIVSAPLIERFIAPKFAGLLEYGSSRAGAYLLRRGLFMPWELPKILDPDIARDGWRELQTLMRLEETAPEVGDDFQAISALELSWYMRNQLLRDSDWAGMAHSVEIRVPFVDVELFRSVAPFMAGDPVTKRDAARAATPPLPGEVVLRRKTGFGIPVRDWIRQIAPKDTQQRGLRSWARKVAARPQRRLRSLALATDAFGAAGGMAKFNRDLIGAICCHPSSSTVVAIPRLMPFGMGDTPANLEYRTGALNSKLKYLADVAWTAFSKGRFDLVICCHINLLPAAWLAARLARAPLVLVIHGIEAWSPTRSAITNLLAKRISLFLAVSTVTKERFLSWARLPPGKGAVLPNSIDLASFYPARKSRSLIARHRLEDKTVLMTLARLSAAERYKGIDEVMELLPELLVHHPQLAYLVVGEGDDRERLERKAHSLGLGERVVFAGYVDEAEKRDYYNLADAFVMPGSGEGFGIVYLEAMACGLPTVGSKADGSVDALRNGELGILVDPGDRADMKRGILAALALPRSVPRGIEYFSYPKFRERVHGFLEQLAGA